MASNTFFEIDFPGLEDAPSLKVMSIDGEEWISYPFRFIIEVTTASTSESVAPETLLGKDARLQIRQAVSESGTSMRNYEGFVANFQVRGRTGNNWPVYALELRPHFYKLAYTRRDRLFASAAVPEIVAQILAEEPYSLEAGESSPKGFKLNGDELGASSFEFGAASYPKRSFTIQYNESDLDFVLRWLAHEGVFAHVDYEGCLQLGDAPAHYGAIATPYDSEDAKAPWTPTTTGTAMSTHLTTAEAVQEIHCQATLLPQKLLLGDYNPATGDTDIVLEHDVDTDAGVGHRLETRNWFRNNDQRDHVAELREQAHRCRRFQYHGVSTVRSFRAGHTFELTGHFDEQMNRDLLLTYVRHIGRQTWSENASFTGGEYRNEFGAVRGSTNDPTFRPQRDASASPALAHSVTLASNGNGSGGSNGNGGSHSTTPPQSPWPAVHGIFRGRVETPGSGGDKGEHALLREDGSYAVELPFPNAGAGHRVATPVRRAQPLAGEPNSEEVGMHFPLYQGTEVMLGFEDGDPDRPIIMGAVPNTETASPVSEENKTQNMLRTRGQNSMLFDDTDSEQRIAIHSPTDDTLFRLGHAEDKRYNLSETDRAAGAKEITLSSSRDQDGANGLLRRTTGDERSEVDGHQDNVVKKNRRDFVGDNMISSVSDDRMLYTGGNRNEHVKEDLKEEVGGNHNLKVKKDQNFDIDGSTNISIKGAQTLFTLGEHVKFTWEDDFSTDFAMKASFSMGAEIKFGLSASFEMKASLGVEIATGAKIEIKKDKTFKLQKKGESIWSTRLTSETMEVETKAVKKIVLVCGPSSIELSPTGIKIVGPKVDVSGLKGLNVTSPAAAKIGGATTEAVGMVKVGTAFKAKGSPPPTPPKPPKAISAASRPTPAATALWTR